MPPTFLLHVPEIIRHCGLLGVTSFGGPSVHFIILHKKFVQDLAWIDEATYQELFALGSASPGPASTTMLFSIATLRGGLFCGFLAFFLWSLPAALAMFGLALGIRQVADVLPEWVYHLLSGLNAAVVGLIAQAGYALAQKGRHRQDDRGDPLTECSDRYAILCSMALSSLGRHRRACEL
jgi:chromate transport protein ChrA